MIKALLFILWISFLSLPFMGIKGALFLLFGISFAYGIFLAVKKSSIIFKEVKMPGISYEPRILYIVIFIILLALPFGLKDYYLDVVILAGIYIILALGLSVVIGFCGLLNLGFAAFYAIGAYACALFMTKAGLGFWGALPLSILITMISGFILAFPALRLHGDYLAIVTLGFGEIVHLTLNNWDSLTHGPNGISGITVPFIFGFALGSLSHYYYIVLIFVLAAIFIVRRIYYSRTGRAWLAIREDETAAEAMGINTTKYKFLAFAFGAFWAGLAGALFASKMRFVSPESFTFMESVFVACMVILGGLGSIPGVIFGSLLLVVLPEALREFQLYRMLALGTGLVLMMVFRPQGLIKPKTTINHRGH
ncbi:MAG: branched-chain amino acid ABC transporter permease [Nitrospirae bacterium]|nr:branched-chain amino acid ABC transporter permease [Nitrospirota bacterium]